MADVFELVTNLVHTTFIVVQAALCNFHDVRGYRIRHTYPFVSVGSHWQSKINSSFNELAGS